MSEDELKIILPPGVAAGTELVLPGETRVITEGEAREGEVVPGTLRTVSPVLPGQSGQFLMNPQTGQVVHTTPEEARGLIDEGWGSPSLEQVKEAGWPVDVATPSERFVSAKEMPIAESVVIERIKKEGKYTPQELIQTYGLKQSEDIIGKLYSDTGDPGKLEKAVSGLRKAHEYEDALSSLKKVGVISGEGEIDVSKYTPEYGDALKLVGLSDAEIKNIELHAKYPGYKIGETYIHPSAIMLGHAPSLEEKQREYKLKVQEASLIKQVSDALSKYKVDEGYDLPAYFGDVREGKAPVTVDRNLLVKAFGGETVTKAEKKEVPIKPTLELAEFEKAHSELESRGLISDEDRIDVVGTVKEFGASEAYDLLKDVGVKNVKDEVNKASDFLVDNVEVRKGEFVTEESFYRLPPWSQELVKEVGTLEFNKRVEDAQSKIGDDPVLAVFRVDKETWTTAGYDPAKYDEFRNNWTIVEGEAVPKEFAELNVRDSKTGEWYPKDWHKEFVKLGVLPSTEVATRLFEVGGLENVQRHITDVYKRRSEVLEPYAVKMVGPVLVEAERPIVGYNIGELAGDRLKEGVKPGAVEAELVSLNFDEDVAKETVFEAEKKILFEKPIEALTREDWVKKFSLEPPRVQRQRTVAALGTLRGQKRIVVPRPAYVKSGVGEWKETVAKEWDELTPGEQDQVLTNYRRYTPIEKDPLYRMVEFAVENPKEFALSMIPVYGTVRNWDKMSTGWKAASVLIDALVIAPMLAPLKGATLGRVGPLIRAEEKAVAATVSKMKQAKIPDATISTFKDFSKSQNEYLYNLQEADRLRKALKTTDVRYMGDVDKEVKKTLDLIVKRQSVIERDLAETGKRYVDSIRPLVEPETIKGLEEVATKSPMLIRNTYRSLDVPKGKLDVAELKTKLYFVEDRLARASSKETVDLMAEESRLKALIHEAQYQKGGLEELTRELVDVRGKITRLEHEGIGWDTIRPLRLKEAELQAKLGEAYMSMKPIYPLERPMVSKYEPRITGEPLPGGTGGGVAVLETNYPLVTAISREISEARILDPRIAPAIGIPLTKPLIPDIIITEPHLVTAPPEVKPEVKPAMPEVKPIKPKVWPTHEPIPLPYHTGVYFMERPEPIKVVLQKPQAELVRMAAPEFLAGVGIMPGVLTATEEEVLTKPSIRLALVAAISNAVESATEVVAEARTAGKTEPEVRLAAETAAKTAAETAVETAIETATETAAKTAISSATEAITKAATKTAVETATKVVPSVKLSPAPALKTELAIKPEVKPEVAESRLPSIPTRSPPPPPSKPEVPEVERVRVPPGSIAWKQGQIMEDGSMQYAWYYIQPPWTAREPKVSLTPPVGAVRTGMLTPQETVQMIGRPGAKVPESVSVDLGFSDIFISDSGRNIQIIPDWGLETIVGKRILHPAEGMSIPGEVPPGITKLKVGTSFAELLKHYEHLTKPRITKTTVEKIAKTLEKEGFAEEEVVSKSALADFVEKRLTEMLPEMSYEEIASEIKGQTTEIQSLILSRLPDREKASVKRILGEETYAKVAGGYAELMPEWRRTSPMSKELGRYAERELGIEEERTTKKLKKNGRLVGREALPEILKVFK